MLKKYIDFITESHDLITESQLIEMLLESDVMFSDNFKKVLGKIDNPVAKKILGLEKKDLPVVANYFDIDSKRNDYLYFTPDRKAQEILNDPKELYRFVGNNGGWLTHGEANKAIFGRLGYVPEGEVYRPASTEVGEVVEKIVSEKSGKTWVWLKFPSGGQGVFNLEKLRPVDDRHKLVWSKNRQDVRVGRSMNALLALAAKDDDAAKFNARDIEIFVNLYKAQIDKFNDKFSFFEEVKGRRIYDKYQYDNYYDASGTLANSCMAEADSSWLEPYTDNDTVSLVIFKAPEDEDMIIGRAILWETMDGKKVMDRIYTNSDSDVELFRQYAQENGWWYKSNNNSSSAIEGVGPEGQDERLYIKVQLKKGHDHFPYMDTMKYYYPETGILTNSREDNGFYYYLEDTDGDWSSSTCRTCDDREVITCTECDGDGEVACNECNGDGDIDGQQCSTCDGEGKKTCPKCDGDEDITCPDCEEYR